MIKMNPFLTVKELHDMCKEHPCDCDFPKPCNLKGIGICPSHETPDEWNIAEPDRPKICYLLDPEHPLKVGEKFNLPNANGNPHFIDNSGEICDSKGLSSYSNTEVWSIFDCLNGEQHIERLPSYPDFTDAEVEALKWFQNYYGRRLKICVDGEDVERERSGIRDIICPSILFPHLAAYTRVNSLDVDAYLKRREQK